MIGKTISHYKIIEEIGRGGMGMVYKAEDTKLKRTVALKFLPQELTHDTEAKTRFIHEAQAASTLQHNNICNVHEIDETNDGQMYICMDYYQGKSLKNKIEGEHLLPIDEILDIAIQISKGLTIAHESEIIHRDLKPANIIVTDRGEVKILDFGLAKISGQTKLTQEGTTLGTIAYMSPEHTSGKIVDHRSDIWQLGVILYKMVTGLLPFKGEYDQAVIYSIANEIPEPISGLRSGIPIKLEHIITKCLQKIPEDRYQHVDDLIVDLRSLKKESESISITTTKKSIPKRSKTLIISVAVFIIAILFISGYYLIFDPGKNDGYDLSSSKWENSIAVLPFTDLSLEKDQAYFCDGLTEQILTNLSKLKKLKVIARTSVNKFKNTEKTIPEIGQELAVENVLEGSVFKSGDNVRIIVQLINTVDGSHIWAEKYDRHLKDMFGILDEVSNVIATNLLNKLSLSEADKILTEQPKNVEVYEYFLKANYYFYKFFYGPLKTEDFKSAESLYKKVIELDPNYAPAYAWLTDLYHIYQSYKVHEKETKQYYLNLQRETITAGYQINPNSAEVNRVKCWVNSDNYQFDSAYVNVKKSLDINPNIAESNRTIGVFYRNRGLCQLAIKYLSRAIELDPLDAMSYISRALAHEKAGNFTEAARDNEKAIELFPTSLFAHYNYFLMLMDQNQFEQAKNLLDMIKQGGVHYRFKHSIALVHASQGEYEPFNRIMHETSSMRLWNHVLWRGYLLLGMKEEFFQPFIRYHDSAFKNKSSLYESLVTNPVYGPVRSDPRFQEILAKHKKLHDENKAKFKDIDL